MPGYIYGHPLEYANPTSIHILKRSELFPLSQQLSTINDSSLRGETWRSSTPPIPGFCLAWSGIVLCRVTTVAMSMIAKLCHSLKVAFHRAPPNPWLFLPVVCYLSPGSDWLNINVPFRTEHWVFLFSAHWQLRNLWPGLSAAQVCQLELGELEKGGSGGSASWKPLPVGTRNWVKRMVRAWEPLGCWCSGSSSVCIFWEI